MFDKIKLTLVFLVGAFSASSQEIVEVIALQDTIKETSGLLYLNQKIITHNDSGGEDVLYEIDSLTGGVNRKVVINNATNVDWEDLTNDDTHIYIADIGNNTGARTDLKVYKILISDFFNTPNDTVVATIIEFSYLDQIDFTPTSFSTNFDAETLISKDDSLYIFTKNWGDNWTNVYPLSKMPGTYQLTKSDSINTQGLITGGAYNSFSNSVVLTSYTIIGAFYVELSNFSNYLFSNGQVAKHNITLPANASFQIEGVTVINQRKYYFSAEEQGSNYAGLYRLNTEFDLKVNENKKITNELIYNSKLKIITNKNTSNSIINIYSLNGVLQMQTQNKTIYLANLNSGLYIAVLKNKNGEALAHLRIVVSN